MWLHEHKNWTNFTWDADFISATLCNTRNRQGRLLGRMESLGFDLKAEANLRILTNDIVKTSAIEGEILNSDEVRSSIARRLGMNIGGLKPVNRNVEGIVEIMLDATNNFSKKLTTDRLFDWHSALFPTGRSGMHKIIVGGWRTYKNGDMQVISGPIGKEKIHFQAPKANRLNKEMKEFVNWFEKSQDIDSVIKAGIAHLWFVTIHPFEDGNGRIARAVCDMALARADGISERFYSLSSQIEAERKEYYNQLEKQQKSTPDITNWLKWFLSCLNNSLDNADKILSKIMFKSKLWNKLNQQQINDRQKHIINKMLEDDFVGYINTSKYAKLTKCSTDTALRDIQQLISYGALIKNKGSGRSTSYRLIETIEIFDE